MSADVIPFPAQPSFRPDMDKAQRIVELCNGHEPVLWICARVALGDAGEYLAEPTGKDADRQRFVDRVAIAWLALGALLQVPPPG